MLKANYHTHSVLCNHAKHTLEEIVELAIKKGFKYFGISEHGPIKGISGKMRIDEINEKSYLDEIEVLKEKYKDKITLYAGYEADLCNYRTGEEQIDWITKRLENPKLDYLIMANHTYGNEGHAYVHVPTMEQAKEWLRLTKKAWATGKFKYIVHPDGFAHAYQKADKPWDDVAYFLAEEITKFASKANMPLGLNVNGLAEGNGYPSLEFFKIAAKNGATAIIELDAHDDLPYEDKNIQKAFDMVNQSGVDLLDKLEI